jgi:hypothetical protein
MFTMFAVGDTTWHYFGKKLTLHTPSKPTPPGCQLVDLRPEIHAESLVRTLQIQPHKLGLEYFLKPGDGILSLP